MAYRRTQTRQREFQPTDPASRKQLDTLEEMLGERMLTDKMRAGIEDELSAGLVRGQASALIQYLALCDRSPEAEAAYNAERVTEPGLYRLQEDGRLYEAVWSKDGDHMYAIDHETGEFARGVYFKLKASDYEGVG